MPEFTFGYRYFAFHIDNNSPSGKRVIACRDMEAAEDTAKRLSLLTSEVVSILNADDEEMGAFQNGQDLETCGAWN